MAENYENLVARISRVSGVEASEVERRVEAKKAKLSGLISKEGAAQIVAAEMGVNLEKQRLKISELVEGMKRANIVGKIIDISPVREFNKNGRAGKVVNLAVADESSNIRVVLWDTNHISLVEQGKLNKGDIIEIANGGVRSGELHLGSFSDIKLSNEKIEGAVVTERVFEAGKIKDAKPGQKVKIRAVIVQVFEPRYFEVCPECGKRALDSECKIHGKIEAKKRALLNLVIDDGTETMRSVVFAENIRMLGLSDEEIYSLEKFDAKKNSLLGEEKIFYGSARTNTLYNTTEFNIEKIEEMNIDTEIAALEGKK